MENSIFWDVTPMLICTELHATVSQNIEYFNFVDRSSALRFPATDALFAAGRIRILR
jgi:hypothetical protein